MMKRKRRGGRWRREQRVSPVRANPLSLEARICTAEHLRFLIEIRRCVWRKGQPVPADLDRAIAYWYAKLS